MDDLMPGLAPYDHRALVIKARLFLNRAMDDEPSRSFDEQALWASLALELLGKAALSKQSPLLIADINEDGANLLVAAGLVQGESRFTSVAAKTVWKRCGRAFKPFDASEAAKISGARNEYLHGGTAAFTLIPAEAWWPRFWSLASVLVEALDTNFGDLVGAKRSLTVERHLERNARNIEHRLQTLLERARQRKYQREVGSLTVQAAGEWDRSRDLSAGLRGREEAICPACDGVGVLEGDLVTETDISWEQVAEDDWEPAVTLTIGADYFSCPDCRLVLDSYELLRAAGLEDEFSVEGDLDDVYDGEPEYGND